jgi:FixJ family two-component response regulator
VSQGQDLRDGLSFLQKPFTAEMLAQAVRRTLDTGKR